MTGCEQEDDMAEDRKQPDSELTGTLPVGESALPEATVPAGVSVGREDLAQKEQQVAAEWNVGDVILDLYEVTGELGEGGMGKVYQVHHKNWNLDLAVKSPHPHAFKTDVQKENFVRECETWVNLGLHPHTVSCYYVRTLGGIPRVFAEYVEGGSLKDWIDGGRLYEGGPEKALERILDIAIQFAWGLQYAHDQGLIHQDVKPANVMMTLGGTAKVTDFGLANARAVAGEAGFAPAGMSILVSYGGMTPAYCSPEQAEISALALDLVPQEQWPKLSRRTDIYSWAVSVFEMFNGGLSWESGAVAGKALKQYLNEGPPEDDLPKMLEPLAELLEHCLATNPEKRPKDFQQIAVQLKEIYLQTTGDTYFREEPKPMEALADSLNNRGVSYYDLGDKGKALECFEEALKVDPQHLEATKNERVLEWNNAKITDALVLERLRALEAIHGGWSDYWRIIGEVHFCRGALEEAKEALEKALELDPVNAVHQHLRAEVSRAMEEDSGWLRCLHTFEGHTDIVASVAISPDGRFGLSGSWDKTLRLWDLSGGRCVRTFEGHTNWVNSVAISPDGRFGLSSSEDVTMRLWDLASGHCLCTLEGSIKTGPVKSVAISPDGRFGLLGCFGFSLQMWKLETGRCLRTFEGHDSGVNSVAVSPDSRFGLSGSGDKTLRLWELESGRCLRTFEGHKSTVHSVAISPDGRFGLSGSEDKTLRLWELESGRCLRTFEGHTNEVESVAISPDGRFGLSGSRDNTLRLWELESGSCLRTLEGHPNNVKSVAINPNGRFALSASWDKTLRLWEIQPIHRVLSMDLVRIREFAALRRDREQSNKLLMRVEKHLEMGDGVEAVEILRRVRSIPGYERKSDALKLWHRATQRATRTCLRTAWHIRTFEGHTGTVRSVTISPDGRFGLSGSWDETLRLWELESGRCWRTLEGHTDHVNSVAISPDGRFALSGSSDSKINTHNVHMRLWDLESGRCQRTFEGHIDGVNSVAISPDDRFALSAGRSYKDKIPRLWELESGRCPRTFEGHTNEVNSVAISPDGRFGLSGSWDKTLRLWELESGSCLRTFEGHTETVSSVTFSPDGRFELSGSWDWTLRLWELSSGKCLRTFEGHTKWVNTVAISPDGRFGLSGSNDKTLRIWDLESGRCLRTLEGHQDGVSSVAISPDGRFILSGSRDNTLQLWELDWELEARDPADWDEGARPYLENFLTLHTPYADSLPKYREPTEEGITLALTRKGKPSWTEDDFKKLLYTLGCAGYGWLRPEGVKAKLEEMAASWEGPPPLK